MDKCYEVYEPENHKKNVLIYGQDSAVCVLANGGWLRWFQGYPQQAEEVTDRAIALAEQINHAFSLCFALSFKNRLYVTEGNQDGLDRGTERLAKVSTENDIRSYSIYPIGDGGWLLSLRGKASEGIPRIRQTIGIIQSIGNVLHLPFYFTLLAQAYGLNGQYDEAIKTIDEGLAVLGENEARFFEAEMHRVKGDLLLKQSPAAKSEAATSFRQAIDIARRAQAKSLELRAAMSLFRAQGESVRAELAGIYAWFTEGFDTPDLKEARALLGDAPKT